MAVLSLIEMLKSEPDPIMSGLIENIITVDKFVPHIPFVGIEGDHVTFAREKAIPTTSTPSSGATITPDNALADSRVSAFIRRFVVDQDIDNLDARGVGGMDRARAKAIAKAAKSLGRQYASDVISGNANWTVTINSFGGTGYTGATIVVGPGHDTRNAVGIIRYTHSGTTVKYKAPGDAEFGASVSIAAGVKIYSSSEDKWVTLTTSAGSASASGDITFTISATGSSTPIDGMLRLLASAQTITSSTNGDAITLATLDQLADLVTDANGPKAYMMHQRTRRVVASLLRAAGGATMSEYKEMQFGTGRVETVLHYNGIPVLETNWNPITQTQGSSSTATTVWCATLGEDAGLSGIYSKAMPGDEDPGELLAEGDNGLTVLNIGTVQASDTKRIRVRGYWGLKNASEKGLAAATGITS